MKHFGRAPEAELSDSCWLVGYVAALEDLPDELLSALQRTEEPFAGPDRHHGGTTIEERADTCEHGVPRRFCTAAHGDKP